jgi:hypothetical protein
MSTMTGVLPLAAGSYMGLYDWSWPLGRGRQWLLCSPPISRIWLWPTGRFGEARVAKMGRAETVNVLMQLRD